MPPPARFYPPGLPGDDPLVYLYRLVYGLMDRSSSSNSGNNGGGGNSTTNISVVSGGGGSGNSNAASEMVEVWNLTSNSNVTVPVPASAPAFYTAVLVQPANGNGAVVWDSGFLAASNYVDPSNNTISVFRFGQANINGNVGYVMIGQPTTGMTL